VRGDGTSLPVGDDSVDGVVSGFTLRNLVSLAPFLDECARAVRPGGRIALLEVSTPANPVLRAGHAAYFGRVVPFVGGLLSDRAAYSYLPKSVAYLPPDRELLDLVAAAGFPDAARRALSTGIAQLITGTRSGR
jgi:demethylmenaquinone methyltransferase/2-methoxy-6-polyprenyl-1,4-benzoquinol methylase